MPRIVITIEDMPNGMVKTVSEPNAETLISKIASHGPHSMTPAETYAMAALNHMRDISKRIGERTTILIPRIGKR